MQAPGQCICPSALFHSHCSPPTEKRHVSPACDHGEAVLLPRGDLACYALIQPLSACFRQGPESNRAFSTSMRPSSAKPSFGGRPGCEYRSTRGSARGDSETTQPATDRSCTWPGQKGLWCRAVGFRNFRGLGPLAVWD